jgi:hypothetical protein
VFRNLTTCLIRVCLLIIESSCHPFNNSPSDTSMDLSWCDDACNAMPQLPPGLLHQRAIMPLFKQMRHMIVTVESTSVANYGSMPALHAIMQREIYVEILTTCQVSHDWGDICKLYTLRVCIINEK